MVSGLVVCGLLLVGGLFHLAYRAGAIAAVHWLAWFTAAVMTGVVLVFVSMLR